ncbi:hypothetical protein ASF56_16275 [Methylobacterium sp. Leaf122]|nr:hypothetical protein [Methylobacterium sp. Leaf122]KQQ24108.1 hypothetical protein ASF56_16275 [Methylobacterium sp. Leaf122]
MQRVLPLTDQVRAALTEDRTSSEITALVSDLKLDLERIRADLIAAKAKAVDPLSSMEEADHAREAHHRLGFEEERATSSIARLNMKLAEVERAEAAERGRLAYEAAVKERDACAALIREEYPKHAAAIAEILQRVMVCNEQIKAANPSRPDDAPWLAPPEKLVRDADDVQHGQLIDLVALPGMHRDAPLMWFRRQAAPLR